MKTIWKHVTLTLFTIFIVFAISACGGAATPDTSYTSTPTPTTEATATPTPTPTTATTSDGDVVIKTATATVKGQSKTILTDVNGKTLYYFTSDAPHNIACTGGCADTWPPLIYKGTGTPKASTTLSGELEVYDGANGKQVVYNDHYLYTYVADQAPGDTNGEGVGGKWYVATPDLAKA